MAAAVGEIAKDTQYQDIVNDNGGDFIPLVCETFGVWSPYALSILGSIVDRTNGLPRKFARRQLLQQLSVTLWRYNVKMIYSASIRLLLRTNFLTLTLVKLST